MIGALSLLAAGVVLFAAIYSTVVVVLVAGATVWGRSR